MYHQEPLHFHRTSIPSTRATLQLHRNLPLTTALVHRTPLKAFTEAPDRTTDLPDIPISSGVQELNTLKSSIRSDRRNHLNKKPSGKRTPISQCPKGSEQILKQIKGNAFTGSQSGLCAPSAHTGTARAGFGGVGWLRNHCLKLLWGHLEPGNKQHFLLCSQNEKLK